MDWLCTIQVLATLLEPTHWAHKFSVEVKLFGGRVRDVVR